MRHALVDNATLTSVQRLLGQIPIRNEYVVDADIAAFEHFVTAILFYDHIFAVDDYQVRYRKQRHEFFPEIQHWEFQPEEYDRLRMLAHDASQSLLLKVSGREGGAITDNLFAPFLQMLRMNVVFTWDISSSAYWLTVNALCKNKNDTNEIQRYGHLASMIHDQLNDKRAAAHQDVSARHLVTTSQGLDVNSALSTDSDLAGINGETASFLDGLLWLAYRTIFYCYTAEQLGADLVLHPIRHAFSVQYCHSTEHTVLGPLLQLMNDQSQNAFESITQSSSERVFASKLPLFSAYLAKTTGDPRRMIAAAYDLRGTSTFVEARRQLDALFDLYVIDNQQSRVREQNKLLLGLSGTLDRLLQSYSVKTPQGPSIGTAVAVYNSTLGVLGAPKAPKIDLKIPWVPADLRDRLFAKGFNAVYRSVVSDLASIAKLGSTYDILASAVVRNDKTGSFPMKVQETKFQGKSSWWRRPL